MEYKDKKYMRLAIALARHGRGKVSPNPMVGCVIVKNGAIIGKGYHRNFGGPHAEVQALKSCKRKAEGAVMYVNLEPCCHKDKKTPPCVPEIIKAGIKEVIISMKDPNHKVSGRGIRMLKLHGIKCRVGVLQEEAKELNKTYIKWIIRKMPYVILKSAISLDGKIATKTGDSKWITSKHARTFVHRLRSQVDSVLVGANTVIRDNPSLTSHGSGRNPIRVVVTPSSLPPDPRVFDSRLSQTLLITTGLDKQSTHWKRLEKKGIKVLNFKTKNGRINFKQIMCRLAQDDIASVLIEGGGETNALALKDGVVDEIMFFIAPKIVGGRNAKTSVEGEGINKISQTINLKSIKIKYLGQDILVQGKLMWS